MLQKDLAISNLDLYGSEMGIRWDSLQVEFPDVLPKLASERRERD